MPLPHITAGFMALCEWIQYSVVRRSAPHNTVSVLKLNTAINLIDVLNTPGVRNSHVGIRPEKPSGCAHPAQPLGLKTKK